MSKQPSTRKPEPERFYKIQPGAHFFCPHCHVELIWRSVGLEDFACPECKGNVRVFGDVFPPVPLKKLLREKHRGIILR